MPNKAKIPLSRDAICTVLAENLDDALLAQLFPGHDSQTLRQILASSAPAATAPTCPDADRQRLARQAEPKGGEPRTQQGWCKLFTDGASRGNPGHAGAGAVLFNDKSQELARLSAYVGICTNNVAEYQALLTGLKEARRCGCSHVALFLDSELVVRQLQGRYRVKHAQLQPLYQQVCALLADLSGWSITHVPRSDNTIADKLANEGIDSHLALAQADSITPIQDSAAQHAKQASLFSG